MGTYHPTSNKKISTDTLNTNMTDNQDTIKGRHYPYDNHNHHFHHPFDNHGGDVGEVV